MILDQGKDALGVEFYRLSSLYDAPGYVKSATEEQIKGVPGMARHGYADQGGLRFPLHTAAATWASAAHFLGKQAEFADDEAALFGARIKAAADYWAIRGDFEKLAAAMERDGRLDDDSLDDSMFAVVEASDDGGGKERHMRLLNPAEIKVAAQWLGRHRDEFMYDDRRTVARKIIERAEATKTAMADEVAEPLEKMAGFGTCAARHAVALLRGRAAIVAARDEKLAADMRTLADDVAAAGAGIRAPEVLHKIASVVDKCDRIAGLRGDYASGDVDRPEDVLFRITGKVARDYASRHVASSSGAVYRTEDLAGLAITAVRDRMGDGFADAVVDDVGLWMDTDKLAAIMATMPRDDAEAFDRLAAAAGAAPVSKHASSNSRRLDLAAVAAAVVG